MKGADYDALEKIFYYFYSCGYHCDYIDIFTLSACCTNSDNNRLDCLLLYRIFRKEKGFKS